MINMIDYLDLNYYEFSDNMLIIIGIKFKWY
jgi:hypothetical protein